MKILIFIIFGIVFLECNPSKKLIPQVYNNKSVDIDIVFNLNKNDYSYQFKFLNKSIDTIKIITPEITSGYSYFRKIAPNGIISNERCIFFTNRDIGWIELLPGKQVVSNGRFSLKTYFCSYNNDDRLAFIYNGVFKRENGGDGILNFEILPTKISTIDSISISKILF
jgi:hypothetical protein